MPHPEFWRFAVQFDLGSTNSCFADFSDEWVNSTTNWYFILLVHSWKACHSWKDRARDSSRLAGSKARKQLAWDMLGTCGELQIVTRLHNVSSSLEVFSFGKREELQMQFCNTRHVEVGTCDVLTSTWSIMMTWNQGNIKIWLIFATVALKNQCL